MAEEQPAIIQEGQPTSESPVISLEGSLLSLEKLDRASPELWPEQIPGISSYAQIQSPSQPPPQWSRGFTQEDISLMQQLASLSTSNIILEVKKLHDLAYRLGVEEAKEMTRGKYLNVFTRKNQYDY